MAITYVVLNPKAPELSPDRTPLVINTTLRPFESAIAPAHVTNVGEQLDMEGNLPYTCLG